MIWPFRRERIPAFESWPIVRTKPAPKTYGRSVSMFINNGQCYLTTVDVYSDGSVDCWGFEDLKLFRGKVQSRWVVPAPRNDQQISVFNFGYCGARDARWHQTSDSIIRAVEEIVSDLNPGKKDLVDMHGSDTEVRGKVRYAKMGLSDKKPYRIHSDGNSEVLGDSVPILGLRDGTFILSRLVVYADGLMQLGDEKALFPIDQLSARYDRNEIANQAPSGSTIILPGLGTFRTDKDFGIVSVHDRIGELHDKLNELNGKPSVVTICANRFDEYEKNPSPEAKESLRLAYESVPEHLRCYCGDMDTRDTAIRAVLFGEEQLE